LNSKRGLRLCHRLQLPRWPRQHPLAFSVRQRRPLDFAATIDRPEQLSSDLGYTPAAAVPGPPHQFLEGLVLRCPLIFRSPCLEQRFRIHRGFGNLRILQPVAQQWKSTIPVNDIVRKSFFLLTTASGSLGISPVTEHPGPCRTRRSQDRFHIAPIDPLQSNPAYTSENPWRLEPMSCGMCAQTHTCQSCKRSYI